MQVCVRDDTESRARCVSFRFARARGRQRDGFEQMVMYTPHNHCRLERERHVQYKYNAQASRHSSSLQGSRAAAPGRGVGTGVRRAPVGCPRGAGGGVRLCTAGGGTENSRTNGPRGKGRRRSEARRAPPAPAVCDSARSLSQLRWAARALEPPPGDRAARSEPSRSGRRTRAHLYLFSGMSVFERGGRVAQPPPPLAALLEARADTLPHALMVGV